MIINCSFVGLYLDITENSKIAVAAAARVPERFVGALFLAKTFRFHGNPADGPR
jgi:hypothetical protein